MQIQLPGMSGGCRKTIRMNKPSISQTSTNPTAPRSPIKRAVETVCDIAANGLPIGKDARLVADITDLNHGEYKAKPAAIIGIKFSF